MIWKSYNFFFKEVFQIEAKPKARVLSCPSMTVVLYTKWGPLRNALHSLMLKNLTGLQKASANTFRINGNSDFEPGPISRDHCLYLTDGLVWMGANSHSDDPTSSGKPSKNSGRTWLWPVYIPQKHWGNFLWKSSKLKPQLHGSLKINHKSKLYEHQTRVCTFSKKNRPLVCFYSKALHFRLLAHLVLSKFLEC